MTVKVLPRIIKTATPPPQAITAKRNAKAATMYIRVDRFSLIMALAALRGQRIGRAIPLRDPVVSGLCSFGRLSAARSSGAIVDRLVSQDRGRLEIHLGAPFFRAFDRPIGDCSFEPDFHGTSWGLVVVRKITLLIGGKPSGLAVVVRG